MSLEAELRALAADVEYPPTPDLATAVGARLQAGRVRLPRGAWLPRGRRLVIAIAILVAIPAGALAASDSARHAILRALGLRGVEVRRVPELPSGLGRNLALGRRVTLAAARAATSFPLLLPPSLGAPDEVYRGTQAPGGQVALVWRARPGLPRAATTGLGALLTEVRGTGTRDYLEKFLGPGSRAEPVSVGGRPGLWLTGTPHGFAYLDARGVIRAETLRLAGDTLVWERGGLVLRLESALSKRRAIALAASLR